MSGATKLMTAGGGGVNIQPASSIASDVTVNVPARDCTLYGTGASTITSGTVVASTSGTSIDFTGIPSWVKRVTVMFNGVSTNGSSLIQVQLGTSSGVETTGYVSLISSYGALVTANSTTGIIATAVGNASYVLTGLITICTMGSNLYISSQVTSTDPAIGNFNNTGTGRKTTAGTLDRVRITTVNGTDTFDAGSINILYE